jgi:hypothetical protein
VARATPRPVWGDLTTPTPKEMVQLPQKAKKKKQKKQKQKKRFWTFEGGRSHPKALGGGSATPKNPKPIFRFFFFFFFGGPFGGGRTTPLGLGVVRPPQTGRGGDSSHPRFSYVSFFFSFNFHLFLKKKKKKKINGQIMSFWAGWVL